MKFLAIFALYIVSTSAFCDNAGPMKEAWEHIRHNEVEMLYTVFKAHPDIQAKFPKFAGKDLEEIKGNADFTIHATRIFGFMTEVAELFGDDANIPAIKNLTIQLGKDHRARGVTVKQFEDFLKSLETYLRTHVKWNDKVEASWFCAQADVYKILHPTLEGRSVE